MGKTLPSTAGGAGLVPDRETKIPHGSGNKARVPQPGRAPKSPEEPRHGNPDLTQPKINNVFFLKEEIKTQTRTAERRCEDTECSRPQAHERGLAQILPSWPPEGTNLADSLIEGFQHPALGGCTCFLFKLPGCGTLFWQPQQTGTSFQLSTGAHARCSRRSGDKAEK